MKFLTIKRPFYLFLVSLQFLTRLPVPKQLNPSTKDLQNSMICFPLVGGLMGFLLYLAFMTFAAIGITGAVQSALLVLVSVCLTGCFHEDGLADTCDGLWGSFEPNRRLEIMKDSRIGTYGSCALILCLLLRFCCYQAINVEQLLPALLISAVLARLSSLHVTYLLKYVSTGSSNKPLSVGIGRNKAILLTISSFFALISLEKLSILFFLFVVCFILWLMLSLLFKNKISGFTGDCLGAANIVTELIILLFYARIST